MSEYIVVSNMAHLCDSMADLVRGKGKELGKGDILLCLSSDGTAVGPYKVLSSSNSRLKGLTGYCYTSKLKRREAGSSNQSSPVDVGIDDTYIVASNLAYLCDTMADLVLGKGKKLGKGDILSCVSSDGTVVGPYKVLSSSNSRLKGLTGYCYTSNLKRRKAGSSNQSNVVDVGTNDIHLQGKADKQTSQSQMNGLRRRPVNSSNQSSLVDVGKDDIKSQGNANVKKSPSYVTPNPSTNFVVDSGWKPELFIEPMQFADILIDEIKRPESNQLSMLFDQLRIQKYLHNFQEEEYEVEDLVEISSDSLEERIPKKGPRKRLKRWIVSQRLKKSDCGKPVLKSLRSNPESKELFTDKFRSILASHCNAHPETKSAMALVEEQKTYILELIAKPKVDANQNYAAFLSHVQKDSADLCRSIYLSLKSRKVQVWYDKTADRLDSRGMVDGIFGSKEFVFIMVRDYFKRRYCIFEWLLAVAFGKPITVLLEDDIRFGGVQIDELSKVVPKLFYEHMIQHEIINVNRIYFDSFVSKLEKRIIR